jgi:NAD+ kinase
MRVILLGSGERPGVMEAVERFRPEIAAYCAIIGEDFSCQQDFSRCDADLAIVFGGDGSILRAAYQMGRNQRPVLSVNLGTLGFLAKFSPEDLIPLLKNGRILSYPREESIMFTCRIWRDEHLLVERVGLNEVSLQTGPPFRILRIHLDIDGDHVTTYRCDGLVICTPVGSTAHNLSSGGPIVRTDLDVFVISPISPHTLSHRPVVDSADREYVLSVENTETPVVIDGNVIATVSPKDRVVITKAEQTFRMIKLPGSSYYKTLREKLGWSGQFESVTQRKNPS